MNVEYDQIAARYDDHRSGGGAYLEALLACARGLRPRRVLELGAGTGNNTRTFLEAHPCSLLALDLSHNMLARAREKRVPAGWVQASAEAIPAADGSVDFVFGVYVLHHLRDLDRVMRECGRVMAAGCAAFITTPFDFIDRHPMNRYFPSFARVDKARFQPVEAIHQSFRRAGFSRVDEARFVDTPKPIGREYVEKVANKFISTYDLIPAEEFAEGVRRLEADVARRGRLEVEIAWESTTVFGWK